MKRGRGRKDFFLLLVIVFLGGSLRLFNLGSFPPGLYFDEVLYGLDAYSILNTGRDLYGHFMPLAFQSSGHYHPLYPYMLVPFIALFSLSDWVVRLPSTLAGLLTIIGIYLLTKTLVGPKTRSAPLLAAALLAFLPWHIHLSRVGYLAALGMPFLVWGSYLFLASGTKNFLILGSILLAISTFSHYGYLLVSPAIFLVLIFLTWNKLKSQSKTILAIGLIWLLVVLGFLIAYKKYNLGFRVSELSEKSILTTPTEYLGAFSFDFLFKRGENFRLNNPWGKGQLQLILLPFLLLGLLSFGKLKRASKILILAFLILTPLPSAIAGLGKHAVRNSPMIIPLVILISLGVECLVSRTRSILAKLILLAATVGFLLETGSDLRYYFVTYPKDLGYLWGKPIREAVHFGLVNQNRFEKVMFVDSYNLSLSYFAFETRHSPDETQKAILNPTTINNIPAKELRNFYFIATEETGDREFYKTLPFKTLLIDPISFIEDTRVKEVKKDNQNLFQYLELN